MNRTAFLIMAAIALAGLSAFLYQQHQGDVDRMKSLDDRVTELSSQVSASKEAITKLSAEQSRLNKIAAQQSAAEQAAGNKHKAEAQGARDDYKNTDAALASRSVPDSIAERLRTAAADAQAAGIVSAPEHPRVYDDVVPGSSDPRAGDSGKANTDRAGSSQLAGNLQRQDVSNP